MHTNRLAQEKSPYLLQHAHNPVEWYPWGPEAFERARREDKPIFLSVGYSTCHWCHVMERESFENEAIAAILNRYFVAVKVDREERPDVDRIYMSFVQATTGSGGWPMSVWLTPELEPFVGGTYFPPEDRYGRAGFPVLLERIADAWRNDREKIVESARDVVQQLQRAAEVSTPRAGLPAPGAVESGFWAFRRTYDSRYGGFGQAPKFPRPSVLNFLLRYHARTKNQEALDMVLHTLREMARGGMYDQLSGGFHRYSVDERWFVPHFEKMLYDQAQLAVSYLEAFQITGDHVYAGTARETLDYVLRDMLDEAGGFYSAEDADSVIDPAHPDIKGEGAFYIWSEAELREALASPVDDWFCYRYGVEKNGNVANDPHEEFTGKNILYQAHSIEETASHFNRALPEVQAGVLQARRKLLELRSHRVRPHLDDKVLTAWNGLMISAFAKAGAILSAKTYADAARRAADFLIGHMSNPTLLRRYRQGDAAIPGFLDDYAYFTQALIDLYESQFHLPDLQLAIRLADRMRELFEDRQNGGFYSTAEGDTALVVRMKDDYDSAEPSGNSIAVSVLLRLAQMADREDFRQSAEKAIAAFHSRITRLPDAVPQMLAACEFALAKPRQIVIAGEISSPDTQELAGQAHARFLPNSVLVLASAEARASVPALAPMKPVADRATAYVCENYACQAPVSDASQLAELLQ